MTALIFRIYCHSFCFNSLNKEQALTPSGSIAATVRTSLPIGVVSGIVIWYVAEGWKIGPDSSRNTVIKTSDVSRALG